MTKRLARSGAPLLLALAGAGGEPVSFRATLGSHGLAWLAPNEIAPDQCALETTLVLSGVGARRVRIIEEPAGMLAVHVSGPRLGAIARSSLEGQMRTMFALDEDLAAFYTSLRDDADLSFACAGVGRLLRSPTAFEDVVRTICTTNCAWSGTHRMIEALVAHLGSAAPDAPAGTWRGHAFPSPAQVASADAAFFRDVARAGYRGPYLSALAASVASGALDLEAWRTATPAEFPDAELEKALLALPGVGPYAAAHIMLLFGRASRLVFDSWTRPRYAHLVGKKKVADTTITRRFKRHRHHAGRAFWLFLWKDRHLGTEVHEVD